MVPAKRVPAALSPCPLRIQAAVTPVQCSWAVAQPLLASLEAFQLFLARLLADLLGAFRSLWATVTAVRVVQYPSLLAKRPTRLVSVAN